MERGYILSIDQSTQGTKAILLDGHGRCCRPLRSAGVAGYQ